MEKYKQHPPFTIQIEPTEGCNLGCSFCGLRGMKRNGKTPWNFMSVQIADEIALKISKAGWKSKIVFAMHGEPTLNKNLFEIIGIFRKHLPRNIFHIISNGCMFVRGKTTPLNYCKKLFDAGINHILLDNYSPEGDWKKIVDDVENCFKIFYFGVDKTPMFRNDFGKDIIILPSIETEKISFVRNLKNHCGAAFPLDHSFDNKRCCVPFRELSFRHDGSVALCCDDFRGKYKIGNISDFKTIEELWNSDPFYYARIMLYNAERSFKPCSGCTSVSMRVGLLPDKLGKDTMPLITNDVREAVENIANQGYLSKIIIKRPWEK